MSDGEALPGTRAAFHRQHQAQAAAKAEQLLARRDEMQGAWLAWVAAQLYQLSPPAYAAMVRRELQRLTQG
ncbi:MULTISPECIES: hypothetical protein [unclassified Pseudomonas]|uniref:hypothetical protein n=1 Tax=unclassified Pseudomonas TaxID=196821 RepID=UPI0037F5A804